MSDEKTSNKDITIRIHAIDQLLDMGKAVLEKLILPPVEEVGLLLTDQIRYFRLKNQIGILLKADAYLKEKGIRTKKVATKVMASYLEDCSLEEDEGMKEKWTALLVNTVREDTAVENALFSYVLGQLSPQDAQILDQVFQSVVTESSAGVGKAWVRQHQLFFTHTLIRENPGADVSIDNLIRLRLLKEAGTNIEPFVYLTNLGFNFVIHCRYPQ